MTITFKEEDDTSGVTDGDTDFTIGADITWIAVSFIRKAGSPDPTAMTWNGDALTKVAGAGDNGYRCSVWHLNNPANDGTYELAWTGTSTDSCAPFLLSFKTRTGLLLTDTDPQSSAANDVLSTTVDINSKGGVVISAAEKTVGAVWSNVEDGASYRNQADENGAAYEISTDATEGITWGDAGDQTIALVSASFHESAHGTQIIWMWMERYRDFMKDLKRGLLGPDVLQERYGELMTMMPKP